MKALPMSTINIVIIVVCFLGISLVLGGWTDDGGYIGQYPAGCATTDSSDCDDGEVKEICVDTRTETTCTKGDLENCRCMYGCEYYKNYLRFEQWRSIDSDNKVICKCADPVHNKTVCRSNDGEL